MRKLRGVLLLLAALLLFPAAAGASTPGDVTESEAEERLYDLADMLCGRFFTTTGKTCRADAESGHSCDKCNMEAVITTAWLKDAVDLVPNSIDIRHYYYGSTLTNGWSCCGFANFAGWYVFSQQKTDHVTYYQLKTGSFTRKTFDGVKPGDILRGGGDTAKGKHSMMFLAAEEDGVRVLDCNFMQSAGNCLVAIHTIPYGYYSKVTVSRAENLVPDPEPDPAELARLQEQKAQVTAFVTRFYQVILEREPEALGLESWTDGLVRGDLRGADVAMGFILSPEYQNRRRTDEAFLQDLYHAFFDREPDAEGYETWLRYLQGGVSREGVMARFVLSPEFSALCTAYGIHAGDYQIRTVTGRNPDVTMFVSRMYTKALDRDYDEAGLEDWTGMLLSGERTGTGLAEGFFLSPELQARGLTDAAYLETLYRTIFDREPDEAGFVLWLELLKTEDRADILDGFTGSQEFEALCGRFGIRVR